MGPGERTKKGKKMTNFEGQELRTITRALEILLFYLEGNLSDDRLTVYHEIRDLFYQLLKG